MCKIIDHFYKIMYKKYTLECNTDSGRKYIVEYHRSPFWAYEKPTLKLFLKKKMRTWHGQVWEVFKNGGRCGFGTICLVDTLFPRRDMEKFLMHETSYLERILMSEVIK